MRSNFLEANKQRNLGNDAKAYQLLKTATPVEDTECFEKVIALLNVGLKPNEQKDISSFAWKSKEYRLMAECIYSIATGKVSDIDLDEIEVASLLENNCDFYGIYLTILNATANKSRLIEFFKKVQLTPVAGFGFYNATLAESYLQVENIDKAYRAAHFVISENAGNPRAYKILAVCEHKIGRLDEALVYAKNAFVLAPDQPEVGATYIASLNTVADYYGAIATFNKLKPELKINKSILEVFAAALMKTGQTLKALRIYKKLIESNHVTANVIKGYLHLQSELKRAHEVDKFAEKFQDWIRDDYDTCVILGYHYLNVGNLDLSHQFFRRTLELSAKAPNVDNKLSWPVIAPRIIHDYEQLTYLEKNGKANDSVKVALPILKKYKDKVDAGQKSFGASNEERLELEHALADYHYVPDEKFEQDALGDNDYRVIEQNYINGKPRLVVIDNFLTPEALSCLRRYCLESSMWKRTYANGYLGSFMSTGFSSRVILKIAEELKIAMPNVVGPHLLKQAWGFKYDQTLKGINLHADFARVNVNFWITPEDCNLDKESGGIVVYDVPAPDSWSFHDYNAESEKMKQFLEANGAKSIRVPYRENRAVLFDSTYFHATDELSFKAGYENRRINCTLLYGQDLRGG